MLSGLAEDHIKSYEVALYDYNTFLEEESHAHGLNERFLEQKIGELEEIASIKNNLYWLTLARLNELILLCAGNYADNFEFTAAGDLLVNPRLILVHMRNRIAPVIKKRHSGLTEQFEDVADSRSEVIRWLKKETFVEIRKEPLASYIYECLKNSGYMSQAYLGNTEKRMKQIADVIGLLSSLHLPNGHDFHDWLKYGSRSEREFVQSNLCRFDRGIFHHLGRDFCRISQDGEYESEFLS